MKGSLNSDGQEFHQYQQTELPHHTSNNRAQKRPQHMTLEIQVLAWDRHKHVVGLNLLNSSHPSPL